MTSAHLESLLKELPSCPGVYKFFDEEGVLLYVGKAKSLKSRVRSYFRKEKGRGKRIQRLVEQIANLEWVEVNSDWEALMLETNLIKAQKPKYNVLMRDDKNFVYVKITKDEDYPRIQIVRKVLKDKARYFGPKTAAYQVKRTLTLMQKLFMYRSCDLKIDWKDGEVEIGNKSIAYPCLDYHIKRCAAPCIAKISPEEYGEAIQRIEWFLEGKTGDIEEDLKQKMQSLATEKEYEKAALVRDKLLAIEDLKKKQIVTAPNHRSADVVGFVLGNGKAYLNLFVLRDGKLINQVNVTADAPSYNKEDEAFAGSLLEELLFQYYERAVDFPKELFLPLDLPEDSLFEDWLSSRADRLVDVKVAQRGEPKSLTDLARANAESYFKQERARFEVATERDKEALAALKDVLNLSKSPKRIECYDISHLGGSDTVASMVVFENGRSKSSDYRKFRLRSIDDGEIDDFKSMNEVLHRRLSRLAKGPVGVKIRKATKSRWKDIDGFYEKLKMEVEDKGEIDDYYLAFEGKKPVGMIKVLKGKGQLYQVKALYVEKKLRAKGVGSALLKHATSKLKMKRLYVSPSEENLDFYKHLSFEEVKKFPVEFKAEHALLLALNPGKEKDASFDSVPNLIVIDGGKGQLSSALKARDNLGLKIPMIGLAKREEDVFVEGKSLPLLIPKDSPGQYLLQRIRDEAHRFALSFQKSKRKEKLRASALDGIEGIGVETKRKLLKKYGSVEQIKKAPAGELSDLVGEKLAERILGEL